MIDFDGVTRALKVRTLLDMNSAITSKDLYEILKNHMDLTPLYNKAMEHDVIDQDSAAHALNMGLQARKLRKSLDEVRKQVIRPHLDFQRSINEIAKKYEGQLQDIEDLLQKRIDLWFETDPHDSVSKITTPEGSLNVNKEWVFEVVNINDVPREYLMVDHKKISEDVELGIRSIPGIIISEKQSVKMRIK